MTSKEKSPVAGELSKIEVAAREFMENEVQMSDHYDDYRDSFKAGYLAGQKALLDEASEGFAEWAKDYDRSELGGTGSGCSYGQLKDWARPAWAAATLSAQNRIGSLEAQVLRYKELLYSHTEQGKHIDELEQSQKEDKSLLSQYEDALFEIANMAPSADAAGKMKKIAQEVTRGCCCDEKDQYVCVGCKWRNK